MTKFAKHPEEMWYYKKVHPDHLKEVHAIGFAFENAEVFSIDIEAVETFFFDEYGSNYYYEGYLAEDGKALMSMKTVDYFYIRLSKEALETEKHVSVEHMFGDNDEENIKYLRQHFESPDIVSVSLFDFKNKEMVDFYVPWVGNDVYHNEGVTITEEEDSILIVVKAENYDKQYMAVT